MKPLVEFRWEVILTRMNSMFELATQEEVDKLGKSNATSSSSGFDTLNLLDEDVDKTLHIKGQMVYMKEWEQMLFLACPMMSDLNNLIWSGLFINDLSMHDYSRYLNLALIRNRNCLIQGHHVGHHAGEDPDEDDSADHGEEVCEAR